MRRAFVDELEDLIDRMATVEDLPDGGGVAVDVVDRAGEFVVQADLPGYDGEDVDLTLSGRQLKIRAERESPDDDGVTFLRRERRTDPLSRTVGLPEEVEDEEVRASLDRGVLTVTLPKRHDSEGKDIEIDD